MTFEKFYFFHWTHVQLLRLLVEILETSARYEICCYIDDKSCQLGSMIESRADLVNFNTKILTSRTNYFDQVDICNALQQTITDCNRLQHTTTHCNTLQHTATNCNNEAKHCNELNLRAKIVACICMYGYICIYVCIYIYTYINICICIYI